MAGIGSMSMNQFVDVLGAGREADRQRCESVCLHIYVDERAERGFVTTLRDALLPTQPTSTIVVRSVSRPSVAIGAAPDLAVVIAGGTDADVANVTMSLARANVPVAVVAESVLDIPDEPLDDRTAAFVTTIAAGDPVNLLSKLAKWMVTSTEKATAFSANFPICRNARVRQLINEVATKNAAAGVVGFVKGTDVATMTSSQVKLAIDICAAHGRPFGAERILDLAGVMGVAFGYTAAAQAIQALVPGLGWAFRAGMGFASTMTSAKAVEAHMDALDGVGPDYGAALKKARDMAWGVVDRIAHRDAVEVVDDGEPAGSLVKMPWQMVRGGAS